MSRPNLTENNPDYIFESKYWVTLLAWKQVYPRLIIFAKPEEDGSFYPNLASLPTEVVIDFQENIVQKVESGFCNLLSAGRKEDFVANWFCMMNDAYKSFPPEPKVHWHFRARIRNSIKLGSFTYTDPKFAHFPPKDIEKLPPEIDGTPEQRRELISIIRNALEK